MKQLLTDSGGHQYLSIVPGFARSMRSRHIPWFLNGVGTPTLDKTLALSGSYFIFANFYLVDGSNWFYLIPVPMTVDQANFFLNSVSEYQVSGWPGNWIGEGFNHLMRPKLTLKLTNTDFFNYLASH